MEDDELGWYGIKLGFGLIGVEMIGGGVRREEKERGRFDGP